MTLAIQRESPVSADSVALITELDDFLRPLSPAESRHGFSAEKLIAQGVDFFVARLNATAVGCIGILYVGQAFGEVKRTYVRPAYRGQRIGEALLNHLVAEALARQIPCLRLEMGINQPAARRLYERFGFTQIDPFPPYRPDPWSLFYEKRLTTP